MDQVTLVENLIADGQKLLERLAHEREDVRAAGWIKTSEEGMWLLYLALPGVKKAGTRDAYRRIQAVIRGMPQPFWLRLVDVKVIDSANPLAVAAADFQRRYGATKLLAYPNDHLGGVSIEGAYIYPPVTAVPSDDANGRE
jgi:hypothetical protein